MTGTSLTGTSGTGTFPAPVDPRSRWQRIKGPTLVAAAILTGSVLLHVTELHKAVPGLLDELGRQGIPLTELRTHSATLEDVFVHLTGRHLRDE